MKLTNTMKDRIVENIMNDTFGARLKALNDKKIKLADAVYQEFYGQSAEKMSALPESFFHSGRGISVSFGGNRSIDLEMSTTRLFGALHRYNAVRLEGNNKLSKVWDSIEKAQSKLDTDRKELLQTLRGIVGPVTTDKRLVEVWPDAEKWIPTTPAAMSNLPALRSEDLNSMIQAMRSAP